MKRFFACIGLIFFINCNDKLTLEKKEKELYIISKRDSIQNLSFKIEHNYYLKNNFVLVDTNKIFFYRNGPIWRCTPTEDKRPVFIDLDTNAIIELPLSSIGEFIDLNFGSEKRFNNAISVASYTDTINSIAFEELMKAFSKNRLPKFLIRRTTLEEEIVLYHKIQNLPYLPDEIEWDATRVNFTFEEDVKNILKKSQEKFKK